MQDGNVDTGAGIDKAVVDKALLGLGLSGQEKSDSSQCRYDGIDAFHKACLNSSKCSYYLYKNKESISAKMLSVMEL